MRSTTIGIVTGAFLLAPVLSTPVLAGSDSLLGGIFGQVKNSSGVAQMGATVLLYDRYDHLARRALTNEQGKFAFDLLAPESYSIRVTLASFVPALRRNIAVAAGSENLLEINLANLFSSVDLISSGPSRGTLLTDDWKWVLRSSQATRPVLRLLPAPTTSTSAATARVFSGTTGVLRVSAGDGESFASGTEEDLGTAFAVATSINGTSRVQFSGNMGYPGNSTIPAAGFRTTYSRTEAGAGPEVTLTVRQLYMPNREVGGDPGPALRTASLQMRDRLDLTDNLHLEYGMGIESVTMFERLTYLSPFARATYDLGKNGAVRVAYSSGSEPAAFAPGEASLEPAQGGNSAALDSDLAALALLPRISRRDDRVQVQRTQNVELGYERVQGPRRYSASIYSENATNVALMLAAPQGFLPWTDTLPDLGTNDEIFNVGSYHRIGLTAAVKQSLGEHAEIGIAAGRTGSLSVDGQAAAAGGSGDDLRSVIHEVDRPWMAMSLSGVIPATGTYLMTSYGLTDARVLIPDHVYMTQDVTQTTGWNIRIRQPLPLFNGSGGRLEATAELRNLLAQGYLPLESGGRKALLTNSPRMVRGGLAFIF